MVVQVDVVVDATDVVPSPEVVTIATKPLPMRADDGILEMVGDEGVARDTVKLCADPDAAR